MALLSGSREQGDTAPAAAKDWSANEPDINTMLERFSSLVQEHVVNLLKTESFLDTSSADALLSNALATTNVLEMVERGVGEIHTSAYH